MQPNIAILVRFKDYEKKSAAFASKTNKITSYFFLNLSLGVKKRSKIGFCRFYTISYLV